MPDEPTNPPEPTRRPRKRMSDADRTVLLEILKREDVRVNGKIHIASVCRLTGLSTGCVYGFLRSDKFFKAQLAETEPELIVPKDEDHIDRTQEPSLPLAMVNFDAGVMREAEAVRKQEFKSAQKDWEALGMTPADGERWEAYCKMGTAPTWAVLRGAGGQLLSNLGLLDQIIKADAERVLNGNLPKEFDKRGEERPRDEVERDWRYMVYAGMTLHANIFSHLHKNQALLARTAADLQKMNSGKPRQEQGVFETRGEEKK